MIRPPTISTLFPYTTLFRSGLHGRAVLHAVLADEATSGQCRADDGRADDHHRHRLSHRHRNQCEHLVIGDVSGVAEFWLKRLALPIYLLSSSEQITV